ncbi:TetR family transcriptional regulator [Epidermidibacterium keratini]|uniref:TetR family transcriptional regulator n=1 Tax=Epidermidibacterium keratini TaxID=1891644 RepID=A0A7L4YNL9_9ACTN|nr:TetR/AcrR family transcriptional regulator [Epidermidibacterium keratini]QHC00464.1 TetR family transcriptional regulator [Epidermidibacterium keratini]
MARGKEAASRERLIESAVTLIRRQGYSGTGVNEIAREGSAPMGSFYYHFPGGKEELAATAMGVGAQAYARLISRALDSEGTFPSRAAEIARATAKLLAKDDFSLGCPVATTALETVTSSEVLRGRSRQAFDEWIGLVADAARAEGIDAAAAHELAVSVISIIEGAEMLARVRGSAEPLEVAASAIARLCVAALGRRGG